jgi:hypothetical protein
MPDVLAPEVFATADRAIARLQPALHVIAAALRELPPELWDGLCRLERIEGFAAAQYYEFAGPAADPLPLPVTVLGRAIVELAVGAEPEGCA